MRPALYVCRTNTTLVSVRWLTISFRLQSVIWLNSIRVNVRPARLPRLVIGTQCGGSDAFSGVTANPAVGYASDLFVRCGATVMFSEVTEVRDAIHLLTPRAINERWATPARRDGFGTITTSIWEKPTTAPNPSREQKEGLANVVEKAQLYR